MEVGDKATGQGEMVVPAPLEKIPVFQRCEWAPPTIVSLGAAREAFACGFVSHIPAWWLCLRGGSILPKRERPRRSSSLMCAMTPTHSLLRRMTKASHTPPLSHTPCSHGLIRHPPLVPTPSPPSPHLLSLFFSWGQQRTMFAQASAANNLARWSIVGALQLIR